MSDKTITLLKAHTHGKHKYPPGSQLTVTPRIAEWLVSQAVAIEEGGDAPARRAVPLRRGKCCGKP